MSRTLGQMLTRTMAGMYSRCAARVEGSRRIGNREVVLGELQ